jgi:LuxR family maltose regulon positive regulatory protein
MAVKYHDNPLLPLISGRMSQVASTGVLNVLYASLPQPPSIASILTTLLSEIITFPDNFILVLDDCHMIDAKPVKNAIPFLI